MPSIIELLKGVGFAVMSAVGFSVLFNIPRRSILGAGFCGGAGWCVYLLLNGHIHSPAVASFCGAVVVGLLGELFAKIAKKPATIFVVPGIIVLVPGYGFYEAMRLAAVSHHAEAARVGAEAFFIAVAIACGIIMTTAIIKVFRPRYREKEQ